jgi:hypothetical protein
MESEELQKVLKTFLKRVIKKSRANLKSKKINASRSLSNSFKYNVHIGKNSIDADILAEDYLKFIDRGVKGVKSGKSLSGFKYTNKKPPLRFLTTWIKQKSGKFRQRNQKQMAFAVQHKVFNYGIKPTKFFTDPFEKEFKELPDEVVEAYALDIENFMKFILKDGGI